MRLCKAIIMRYRSVDHLEIEMGSFTILFGQNNVGKTNILEAIYGILAPETMPGYHEVENLASGVRGGDTLDTSLPVGAVYADLESGRRFDEDMPKPRTRDDFDRLVPTGEDPVELKPLPPRQVAFAFDSVNSGLCIDEDPRKYLELVNEVLEFYGYLNAEWSSRFKDHHCFDGPRAIPMFVDWEFANLDENVTGEIKKQLQDIEIPWLENVDSEDGDRWRVCGYIPEWIRDINVRATWLLPDFLDGSIRAQLKVPTRFGEAPEVAVAYQERGTGQCARSVRDVGRGAARWIAASTQIAMHVLANPLGGQEPEPDLRPYSGYVLFIDEPEAHLHPAAVASIVRWCQRLARLGFNIVVASHHEAFLRASGDQVRFVKVSRDVKSSRTQARTVLSTATPLLQELATEVGMHPATVLSLHRAILFVEGPLDEAVLDEYAGPQLEAAGVFVIPIHGTKNLEGLIDGEFTARLGVKAGVLTDNTVTATMWDRSNRKRSSEEVKLVRLIKRFEDQGLSPPDVFGVPEDDLLFALPADAIREHFNGQFPGWHELREECREALGKGASDSVDWKTYAEEHYHLPLTTADGVRSVLHTLDLAGVQFPSIRAVIDDVIAWAKRDRNMA